MTAYDRESLVSRIHIEKAIEGIDPEEAYRVVPIRDALIESSNREKRNLILSQLKKGIQSNYRTIKVAEMDEDSETVHYVSAVKMEVYNKLYKEVTEGYKLYNENPKNMDVKEKLLNNLSEFIHSGLLQKVERNLYIKKFCDLFQGEDKFYYQDAYNDYIGFLCEMEHDDLLEMELTKDCSLLWNYKTYKQLLNYYYKKGNQKNFYWTLDMLCQSKIVLDQEGIQMIRYWKTGEHTHAIT